MFNELLNDNVFYSIFIFLKIVSEFIRKIFPM